eukprot:8435232-Karenia_brevis.AAC.1
MLRDGSVGLYALTIPILAASLSTKCRTRRPMRRCFQVNFAKRIGSNSAWPITCFWSSLLFHLLWMLTGTSSPKQSGLDSPAKITAPTDTTLSHAPSVKIKIGLDSDRTPIALGDATLNLSA